MGLDGEPLFDEGTAFAKSEGGEDLELITECEGSTGKRNSRVEWCSLELCIYIYLGCMKGGVRQTFLRSSVIRLVFY